jgi:hypothetical protein
MTESSQMVTCPKCGTVTDAPEGSGVCPIYHGRTGDGYCPIFMDGLTREEQIAYGLNLPISGKGWIEWLCNLCRVCGRLREECKGKPK